MNIKKLPDLSGYKNSDIPKYRQIAAVLDDFIKNQQPTAGCKFFADRALAKHFDTTTVTIARSLNLLVNKKMLERRIGAGTFVCYNAANPQSKRRIGVLCHEVIAMDGIYVAPVMHTFTEFWEKCGYEVISFYCKPQNWQNIIRDHELDGVMILVPREEFADKICKLVCENYPVVSIGYAIPGLEGISFGSDHGAITREAVNHLYSAGHRRIALLCDGRMDALQQLRIRSFQQAMWERRLPIAPDWIMQMNTPEDGGNKFAENFKQVFTDNERPSAVLLDNILNIFAVYHLAEENNLQIPEDLSIIGFDDAEFLQYINPPLTVLAQPLEEITTAAAEKLLSLIEKRVIADQTNAYNNKFIKRKSITEI